MTKEYEGMCIMTIPNSASGGWAMRRRRVRQEASASIAGGTDEFDSNRAETASQEGRPFATDESFG